MLSLLVHILLIMQDVLNRRLLFKQTGSRKFKGNHHPSFLRFWNWVLKLSMLQILMVQRNNSRNETQQTFVNGLLGFITLGIYTPLEARVLLTIIA